MTFDKKQAGKFILRGIVFFKKVKGGTCDIWGKNKWTEKS